MSATPDLDAYRQQARQWLSGNLEPRDPGKPGPVRGGHDTPEDYRPARALQKKIYQAGYAGIDEMQRNAISEQILGLPREPSFDRGKPFSEVVHGARDWLKEGWGSKPAGVPDRKGS